jgi:hypothetical protein
MLASTVQFSNNDQPPVTPPLRASSPGPALKIQTQGPYPQTPNSVPGTPDLFPQRSTLRRAVLEGEDHHECRIINVPPLSNHRRTCADVMALDHQTMPGGLDAP